MYPNSAYNANKYTPKEYEELCHKPAVSSNQLVKFTSYLQGVVLTVVDASISDPKQNKAMKNLIKKGLWDGYRQMHEYCIDSEGQFLHGKKNGQSVWFPFGEPNDDPPSASNE